MAWGGQLPPPTHPLWKTSRCPKFYQQPGLWLMIQLLLLANGETNVLMNSDWGCVGNTCEHGVVTVWNDCVFQEIHNLQSKKTDVGELEKEREEAMQRLQVRWQSIFICSFVKCVLECSDWLAMLQSLCLTLLSWLVAFSHPSGLWARSRQQFLF